MNLYRTIALCVLFVCMLLLTFTYFSEFCVSSLLQCNICQVNKQFIFRTDVLLSENELGACALVHVFSPQN